MSEIVMLDPRDPDCAAQYRELRSEADPHAVMEGYTGAHLSPPKGAVIFACMSGGKVVGSVSYIRHSVCRNGDVGIAYQACNVFTHSSQRGMGIFPSIVRHADKALFDLGAKFVFGFPNMQAEPVWTGKLGYEVSKVRSVHTIPLISGLRRSLDEGALLRELASSERIFFDAHETAAWKKKRHNDIVEGDALTNYVFGRKLIRRRAGLPINIFVVGGYVINKPYVFEDLLAKVARKAGCLVCRISCNARSALRKSGRVVGSRSTTEPLIYKGLGWDVSAGQIEVAGGIKDVY